MRLLDAPSNVDGLLESVGYVVSTPNNPHRPRGHVIFATKIPDGPPVVIKCIRKGDSEARMMTYFYALEKQGKNLPVIARMMTYFYALEKQGKNLPVIGVLDLIEDTQNDVVLVVLEDWGRNLAELGRLSPSDFFHILKQCFEAVATLHAMGIAHLDISCYNFLCNSYNQVAVIDFETSRCFNETEVTHSTCHSQAHSHSIYPHRTTEIPPEFRTEDAYQRRHCAYKLDIFALGVLVLRFAKRNH
ncbi:unnamed protein product [Rhizoctonia solani]|uniref:Protein kinase domain-containing protein n=1 Tax=Rhizoctonia solani TaxID=456999 RepID=A0A8H3HF67_9AGAM|nr:unnamed protein product [Rhizoctonia solani]